MSAADLIPHPALVGRWVGDLESRSPARVDTQIETVLPVHMACSFPSCL